MAKGDKIGSRPLAGRKPDEIRTLEALEKEFTKVDALVEEIGNELGGNFHIYKEGFWAKFVDVLESRDNSGAGAREGFLLGGARLPFMPHVFSVRFMMRGAFQELVQANLLHQDDQPMFMRAMPHWEPGLGGMSAHKEGKLLSEMLVKEMDIRNNLGTILEGRGISQKVDEILEHYGTKLGTFWGAVRGYPETFDETKDAEELYRYGLYDRKVLTEIDRAAVEECVQHGEAIPSQIDHGFTHAADVPGSFEYLNKASRKEIESVLGKGS